MKKNISINISGIIFHIEEDGYGKLKEYLESINSYFANYDDSSEIIADIESRVAEIFLSKLDDGKQIIIDEDVEALITTMGTIADFEAIEEEEDKSNTNTEEQTAEEPEDQKATEPRKLRRDEGRKIIGGVAAGVAHYFGMDPLWVRMIMILLLILGPIGGVMFVTYVVLWIVMPSSNDLGDDAAVKKMYRDGENSVMGGVASGIAAYFGVDITVVRLIFVLSFFLGGTGLILYIILWMITPEAKSITDKIKMQGEPVTLSNIEHNVKESLNVKEDEEETAIVKLLLFPFRVLASIFKALGGVFGSISQVLVEGIRIFAGIVITGIGVVCMISIIISVAVLTGLLSNWGGMVHFFIPIEMLQTTLPSIGIFALFFASMVPFLGITLIGLSVLMKRFVLNAAIGWSLFGVWILSMIVLGISTRSVFINFRNEGEYNETRTFEFQDETPVFKLEYKNDVTFDMTQLKLRGHSGEEFKLDLKFKAHGKTRKEARKNAEVLTYDISQSGNELVFSSDFNFVDGVEFRAQELEMTFYIPYNKPFRMDEDLKDIIRNTIHRNGYRVWQMEDNEWIFIEGNGLECITCDNSYLNSQRDRDRNNSRRNDSGGNKMSFELADFDKVEVRGNFDVFIKEGTEYSVELKGRDENLKKSFVRKFDDVLEIDTESKEWESIKDLKRSNKVKVYITMPGISKLEGSGATDFTVESFKYKDLEIKLSGGSSVDINIAEAEDIKMDLDGASSVTVQGDAKYLDADLTAAARLKAYDLKLESAKIETKDASSARVTVRNSLEANASGISSIKYKGDPEVQINEDGLSNVKRTE